MMIKPGISELSKCVDSRYTLVSMAAKRARMIGNARMKDREAFGEDKPVTVASDEIVNGKVGYVRSEAIKRAKEWEDEKVAALHSLAASDEETVLDENDVVMEDIIEEAADDLEETEADEQ